MPNDRTVRVNLQVDSKGAVKSVAAVEDELTDLQKATKATDEVVRKTEQSLGSIGKRGGASATNTLMNLNRVVQDAPFGFVAVANNIDPLLESFQRLSRESGGAGVALRTLFGSLWGGAGLSFAVSALSAIIITKGDAILSWFDDGEEKAEEMRKELDQLFSSIVKFEAQVAGVRITPENIDQVIGGTKEAIELEKQLIAEMEARLGIRTDEAAAAEAEMDAARQSRRSRREEANISDEIRTAWETILQNAKDRVAQEEGVLQQLEDQKKEFEDQLDLQERLIRRGGERIEPDTGPADPGSDPITDARMHRMEILGAEMDLENAAHERFRERMQERLAWFEQEITAIESNAERKRQLAELELQLQEQILATTFESAAMQAQSAKDALSIIRQQIKAIIAQAVMEQALKVLKMIPPPFNILAATVAGAATGAAFEALVPKFRSGVTNFGGGLAQVHQDEIIALPRGSSVISQVDSRAIMAGARQGAMSGVGRMEIVAGRFEKMFDRLQGSGIPAYFTRNQHSAAAREVSFHSELTRTSR